jgi:polynucleotide 5'-hydroxyl-kinase GRC3/NOL9
MHHEQVVLVCGPKGSGKSSFAKYLLNMFLTMPRSSNELSQDVAFLDLDPGQPEYSPPGDISLMSLEEPNLGPAYTHPAFFHGPRNKVVRAHHIGNITPADDSEHYLACAKDLFARHVTSKPLIVNSCGWTQGTGVEIIQELLRSVLFTDIVLFSNQSTKTSTRSSELETAVAQFRRRETSIHKLSYERRTTRSARELRQMQTMSYFHAEDPIASRPCWNHEPLVQQPGQTLRFRGTKPDVHGVMVYSNPVKAELLPRIINGTILALVTIEDPSLIQQANHPGASIPYLFHYNSSGTASPLPPDKSRCLCQVLVRGIDEAVSTLQAFCPFNLASLVTAAHAAGESLVLVSGRLDTPAWAYTEEYYEAQAKAKDEAAWKAFRDTEMEAEKAAVTDNPAMAVDRKEDDGVSRSSAAYDGKVDGEDEFGRHTFDPEAWAADQPWVEIMRRSGAAAAGTGTGGAKKWKVRRNLGTGKKSAA